MRLTGLMLLGVMTVSAETKREQVDRIFGGFNTHTPGCAVGVAVNGQVELRTGYGMADLERAVAIGPETVFESGSVAKQFTAAALLLAEQKGKLSLDDKLGKYLTELKGAPANVTIRQVISHVSGLREWRPVATFGGHREEDTVLRNEDLLRMAAQQRGLNFEPGTHYSYSNTGYNIATILLERALGGQKSFEEFTEEEIFRPLGMTHTRWRSNFRLIVPGRALAYTRHANGEIEQATPIGNIIGAGGLLTTVDDLLRWNENFVTKKVGGEKLVEAQQRPAVLASGQTIPYAAGLIVSQMDGLREVSHSGATGGYRTWLGRYPEKGLSVAVLCNSAQAVTTTLGRRVARVWTGTTEKPVAAVKLEEAALEEFAGMYKSLRNNVVTMVRGKEGRLLAGAATWTPVGARVFAVGASRVEFGTGTPLRATIVGPDGSEVLERVTPVKPTAAQMAEYAGEYASEETQSKVVVRVGAKGLEMQVAGTSPVFGLEPTFVDGFQGSEGAVVFLRDGGKVKGMRLGDGRVWDLRFERVR